MKLKDIVDSLVPRFLKNLHNKSIESDRFRESMNPTEGWEYPYSEFSNPNRWEWRRISNEFFSSDNLSPEDHRSILKRAYHAWCTNPLAGQIVNLTTWFVMGKGLGFTAADSRVQKILSEFWNHPANDMASLQHWMSNELQIYGEIFIRFFVNPIDGSIQIALIDPLEIIDIATDQEDVRKPVAYLREFRKPETPEEKIKTFVKSENYYEATLNDGMAREVIDAGEILHVKVNNVSNAIRGISELYRILPWLDAYDRWLKDRMAINRARGTFAFLRKVPAHPEKASGPFNTDSSGKYITPKPGSILVVHESEEWEVLSPQVGSDDAKEDGRAIKLMIAAGSGIFEHYFGDPSTGNLATTRSMELPMTKKFEDRQRLFENVFKTIFAKVIDSAISKRTISGKADRNVEVNFPPIVPDDVEQLTRVLIDQVNSGIISRDSARRMIPWIGNPDKEVEAIKSEP
ncbi:MAG TPA: phage portal protein [bacterium]|jgi:hypothetical protein